MGALRIGNFSIRECWLVLLCWFCLATSCLTDETAKDTPKRAYDDVKNATELFTHIVKKEWTLALERLEEEPSEASILIERKDRTGAFLVRHLPLHQVFIGDLPNNIYGEQTEMSEEQLQVIKALFRLNPRATVQKDLKKRTLLHLAAASQIPPPVAVINAFVKVNPQALKARDLDDRLPLHSAVVSPMTTFANVEAIIDAYPGAVNITDKDDALPLHLAAWGGGGPDALPVIKILVESNLSSLSVKDGDEETVLALMSKYGRTSAEAIEFVLKHDPKAIFRDRDEREGNTPLHYAVSATHGENSTIYAPLLRSDPTAAEKINKLGKLPLHIALSQCCVSLEMIQDLINAYPLGASLRDGEGFTPLHHACQAGVSDIEIAKLLLESAPKSVRQTASIKGRKSPLPLHLALRSPTESDTMNKMVSLLLKTYPEAARIKDPDTKLAPLPSALMAKRSLNVLRKLMLLHPDSVPHSFEATEEGEIVKTSSLHMLASIGPTYLDEDEMAAIVKDFLVMDPNGAKRRDGKARTPLHIAWKDSLTDVEMRKSRTAFSDALLDAHSNAVQALDDDGRPVVAYASVQRDDAAVNKMLNLYPEGAKVKSREGSFPLHYACGTGQIRNASETIDVIVNRLLQEYPEAASEPNGEGELPIHRVCESAGPDHILSKTIMSLMEAYPEASRQRDKVGVLPLQIAVNNAVESDQPLDTEYFIELIKVLIKSYPEAVSEQDKRGRTPFSSGIQLVDSLSHTRRQEDDPVLRILEMLYDLYPQSVLEKDTAHKTAMHVISQLFGDVGGMMTASWKEFAIRVMRDNPELLSETDKSERTPLHLYILFLGDTAIGARDKQDPKTRRLTPEIEEVLQTMIALYPGALNMREEYNLTPLDLINHKRLSFTRGSLAYKVSPIIKRVKQLLQRDTEYWEMAGDLERAMMALRTATRAANSGEVCLEIRKKLSNLQQRITSSLQQHETTSNETDDSCPDTTEQHSQPCPDEVLLMDRISADLGRLASMNDASLEEE